MLAWIIRVSYRLSSTQFDFVLYHDQFSENLNPYPRLGKSLSRSPLSLLLINNYISAFLHHAIITAYLYIAKPPQSASSNAVPNVIKAHTLPQF